jgi:hypothetical protein
MPFSERVREEALVKSRRWCCLCQGFSGRDVNVHHIVQEAKGGTNDSDNAIVLCLKCHSEAGHYNPDHPVGTKYSEQELGKRRDLWYKWCEENPNSPLPNEPIAVAPEIIDFGSGDWKSISQIKVMNRTNEAFFQIWIKIEIANPLVSSNSFEIVSPKIKEEIYAKLFQLRINPYIERIDSENALGNNVVYIIMYSLDPHETFTLNVEYRPKEFAPINGRIISRIRVLNYCQAPASIQSKRGRVSLSFTPPEKFIVKAMRLYIKADKVL